MKSKIILLSNFKQYKLSYDLKFIWLTNARFFKRPLITYFIDISYQVLQTCWKLRRPSLSNKSKIYSQISVGIDGRLYIINWFFTFHCSKKIYWTNSTDLAQYVAPCFVNKTFCISVFVMSYCGKHQRLQSWSRWYQLQ